MPVGRCAGCGLRDSCRRISTHILSCARYLQLFHTDRARCLDPAAEYDRFRREDDTQEARAAARDARLAHRFAELEALSARHSARWSTPVDILD